MLLIYSFVKFGVWCLHIIWCFHIKDINSLFVLQVSVQSLNHKTLHGILYSNPHLQLSDDSTSCCQPTYISVAMLFKPLQFSTDKCAHTFISSIPSLKDNILEINGIYPLFQKGIKMTNLFFSRCQNIFHEMRNRHTNFYVRAVENSNLIGSNV